MSMFRMEQAACTFRVQSAAVPCVAATVAARAVQSCDGSQFIGKETVMRCLKVLFVHISGVTEEN